jgi:outer membrane protein assembly factor BamA
MRTIAISNGRLLMVLLPGIFISPGLSARPMVDSVTVSKIVIVGNETTRDYVIIREMILKVGARLDTAAMEHDKKQIYSLQLFNKVDIDYTIEGKEATVFVRVSERWYIFPLPIVGFKYRDLKKMFYGLSLIHQNLRGRNEKIMASAVFGYDGWFDLAYQNPRLTDDDDIFLRSEVGFHHVRNQNTSEGEYDQKVSTGSVMLGKRHGLYLTVFGFARFDMWDVPDLLQGRTVSSTGIDRFITIGSTVQYDRRDIREYATAGEYISVSLVKYGLGESDVNLFRYGIDLRDYEPLGGDVSLCGRVFGSFLGGGVSPTYLHAYFGYFDRIRGYYSTVLEGENIAGGGLELRVPILKPRYTTVSIKYLPPEFSVWRYGLYAGVFADGGTAWFRTDQVLKNPWYAGYGAGLHFLLPYSLVVRTEYAINQHGKSQFVFGFGASF